MAFLLTFVAGLVLVEVTTETISNGGTLSSKAIPEI